MKNQASKFRAYYYFLLGMFGGLTGWFIMALAFRGMDTLGFLTLGSRGIILGGLIGLSIAAYDGFISRSFRRFFKLGLSGLFLGVVAGVIALPLAQWVFGQLWPADQAGATGAFSPRAFLVGIFCWTILGSTIGFVEVIGKGTQSLKGLLGGVFGGISGGSVYEVARAYGYIVNSDNTQIMQAFCLALMGGFIGLSVALIPTLLRRAWVVVVDGKFAGYEYDVTKYVSKEMVSRGGRGLIGSDELRANIYLPADKEVVSQHAILCYANEAPTLLVTPEAQKMNAKTLVNGYPVLNCPLSDGDEIKIGTTSLLYHQIRKGKDA
jgi:hypothetical protein